MKYQHFETPEWAASAILKREILTPWVIDPCAGTGVMTRAAEQAGYNCMAFDIQDWGVAGFTPTIMDWLVPERSVAEFMADNSCTVFMNPPFKEAVEFVKQAFDLGARKVVCFQRFAWWESRGRGDFWRTYPPNRVYVCGERADCWRHDIPKEQRGSSSPTAHGWFVWEQEHPPGTLLGHIWKEDAI